MRVDSTMSRRFGLEGVWSDITSRLNEELGDRYMRLGSEAGGQFPDPTKFFGTSDSLGNGDARYTYEATRIIDKVLQLELDNAGTVPEDILSLMNMQAIENRMREDAMASPRKPDADHRAIPRHWRLCALHGRPVGRHV